LSRLAGLVRVLPFPPNIPALAFLQKTPPIKKAAANAAAKVRRWIKELQINVSEHLGDGAKNASIHQKSVADDSVVDFVLRGAVPLKPAQNKRPGPKEK